MSFNDGEKIGRKFASARAKWESWRELLLGENYSLSSTYIDIGKLIKGN